MAVRLALKARKEAQADLDAPQQPTPMPAATGAAAKIEQPPNLPVVVNEKRQTPYKRIQHKQEQRKAKTMQREEEERFFDDAIEVAEDERTEMAKSADNPCTFKEAVNENDNLQPRQKHSIIQSAKDINYSISQKF